MKTPKAPKPHIRWIPKGQLIETRSEWKTAISRGWYVMYGSRKTAELRWSPIVARPSVRAIQIWISRKAPSTAVGIAPRAAQIRGIIHAPTTPPEFSK